MQQIPGLLLFSALNKNQNEKCALPHSCTKCSHPQILLQNVALHTLVQNAALSSRTLFKNATIPQGFGHSLPHHEAAGEVLTKMC